MRKNRAVNASYTIFLPVLLCLSLLCVSCTTQTSGVPPVSTSTISTTTAPIASGTPATCGKWTVAHSPASGNYTNMLYGIAALSTTDAWAVGTYGNTNGPGLTLIEHWNGSTWSVASSPNPAEAGNNQLFSVTALSTTDAWAVGSYFVTDGARRTLIEHWNGKAWSIVPSPNPAGSVNNDLLSIAAVSASDIWAVGQLDTGHRTYYTLIEHWNGSAWSITSRLDTKSQPNFLQAVTRVPATGNVWAAGYQFNSNNLPTPLIESYC